MPLEIKERVIKKYQSYGGLKPNVVHFCELLAEEDDIIYSDTTVRKLLYQAGYLSPKTQRKRNHITSIDEANWYLDRWIKRFNKQFGRKATESVFEKAPKPTQRNLLLARVSERGVDSGHHIRYQNNFYLPVEGQTQIFFI